MTVAVAACNQTLVSNAANTLKTTALTVELGRAALAEADKAGKLDVTEKQRILAAHEKYKEAFDACVKALAAYKAEQSGDNERALQLALDVFNKAVAELLPLLPKLGGT